MLEFFSQHPVIAAVIGGVAGYIARTEYKAIPSRGGYFYEMLRHAIGGAFGGVVFIGLQVGLDQPILAITCASLSGYAFLKVINSSLPLVGVDSNPDQAEAKKDAALVAKDERENKTS